MSNREANETPVSSSMESQVDKTEIEQLRADISLLRRELNTIKAKSRRALFTNSAQETGVKKQCSVSYQLYYLICLSLSYTSISFCESFKFARCFMPAMQDAMGPTLCHTS